MRLRSAAIVLALLACAACDRRLEPWVESEAEPPQSERPVRIPGLDAPIARTGPGTAVERVPSPAVARGSVEDAPGIRGTVRLADGQRSGPAGTLFLVARTSETGPPLAVKRLPAGPFPLAFEIGPADVMLPGMPFAGSIRISARIDADGDPLTRLAGEPSASLAEAVEPGAQGVELVLRPDSG